MPGDTIQFINGELFINDKKISKKIENKKIIRCGNFLFETDTLLKLYLMD